MQTFNLLNNLLKPDHPLNRPVAASNLLWAVVVTTLLIGNAFFIVRYYNLREDLRQTQAVLQTQTTNEKVLEFTKLFIGEVLKAEGEVSFDTRLKLETAVRNLNDEEILNQWQKFVDSKTENQAQEEVKNLLEMLVGKVKVK